MSRDCDHQPTIDRLALELAQVQAENRRLADELAQAQRRERRWRWLAQVCHSAATATKEQP